MPYSMTGFARQIEQGAWGEMSCEIRSVNHRYLEPIIRLPEPLRALEPEVRDLLRKQLQRGKVEVNIQLSLEQNREQSLSLNKVLLLSLLKASEDIKALHEDTSPLDLIGLMQWPGVIEQSSPDLDALQKTAVNLFVKTLTALVDHRQREGRVLKDHIDQRLQQIAELVSLVRQQLPGILAQQKQKLRQRLSELTAELDENRIEQEMVLLANKADVAEELDRLNTHIDEVRHILLQDGPVGRRLDFMMQELNREANTLSSKSLASDTTQAAVSMKVLIEQMREQIQNME
ncbi:MAG: YicC/YloC family endoribonuclease [Pseudomonadota bacterium]